MCSNIFDFMPFNFVYFSNVLCVRVCAAQCVVRCHVSFAVVLCGQFGHH